MPSRFASLVAFLCALICVGSLCSCAATRFIRECTTEQESADSTSPAASGVANDTPMASSSTSSPTSASSASTTSAPTQESGLPTGLIAEYDGVLIHSPIRPAVLTGLLFHQASYDYALAMATQLPEADADAVFETKDFRIAATQPTGEIYLSASALHIWRTTDTTPMDTSVDVGAPAGTEVYAPVTGTVVLVKEYELFDVCTDYEIHIQPDGRSDLDVVVIHTADPLVKAGDRIVGGTTPISHVRDIAAILGDDIQLADYTAEGTGNHTHVQVNDANYPDYRKNKLEGAITVN